MDRQETATYLTPASVTSSTTHIGPFNVSQRSLFSHLDNTETYLSFDSDRATASATAPLSISTPWVATNASPANKILINNHYPIDYFALPNLTPLSRRPPNFWASTEAHAPTADTLELDLGRIRPVNLIDFEISQKPIDIKIEYFNGSTWELITSSSPINDTVMYQPSTDNSWKSFSQLFDTIEARYIRLTFTRRSDPFPLTSSLAFPFSVDVRNLRLMFVVSDAGQFVIDNGTDILGNAFRTDIDISDPGFVIDDDLPGEYGRTWRSQPNPSPSAVEALYFDLRSGINAGTMAYLGEWGMEDLDTWTMTDLTNHFEDGVVIDEVFVDPVTTGVTMHFYYSVDDTPDDDKLWIPVPKQYIARKGFHPLPLPTFCKYFKIEFSNLAAVPYQPVEFPEMPPVTFKTYPTWVENYFKLGFISLPEKFTAVSSETVTIDPLTFGFQNFADKMTPTYETERLEMVKDHIPELTQFIQDMQSGINKTPGAQEAVERQIEFHSPLKWQTDLIQQMDTSRALTRFAQNLRDGFEDTGWNAELGLPFLDPPTQQSASDLSPMVDELKKPDLYFARRCRHQYKEIETTFSNKVAYHVAIRQIKFFRRDFQIEVDEPVYIDSLFDDVHAELNEFVSNDDYKWVVVV